MSQRFDLGSPWQVGNARVLMHGSEIFVGVNSGRSVTMDDTEIRSSLFHWDGAAWTELQMPWPGTTLAALTPEGTPLALGTDPAGERISVLRWGGGVWQSVVSEIPIRAEGDTRSPHCLSLRQGPAGLVLTWSLGDLYAPGVMHAVRVNPETGAWEPLGDGPVTLEGQGLWTCPSATLDAVGHPVLAWSELKQDAAGHWVHSDIRAARWREDTRSWVLLGAPLRQVGGSTFFNSVPTVAVGPDGVPVLGWMAEGGQGRSPRVVRYDAAADRWTPLGSLAEPAEGKSAAVMGDLLHDSAGRLIACVHKEPPAPYSIFQHGLFCQRLEGSTWSPVGPWPLVRAHLFSGYRHSAPLILDASDAFVFPGETEEGGLQLYRREP